MSERYWEDYWTNHKDTGRSKQGRHMNYETHLAVQKAVVHVGGKVLDVGCGEGSMYDYLKDTDLNYRGIDISKKALNKFKKYHPEVDVQCASCFDIPFSDNFFDTVFCTMFLEHLHPEEYPKAIREMVRVAKKQVIIGWFRAPWSKPTWVPFSGRPYFSSRYNVDEVKKVIESLNGFKSLRILTDISLRMPESWWSKNNRRTHYKREVYVIGLENKCPA